MAKHGQVVTVDQLESNSKGYIAQLKGLLTTKHYQYASVFVDLYSLLYYQHLQKTLSSQETVQAKQAFEKYA